MPNWFWHCKAHKVYKIHEVVSAHNAFIMNLPNNSQSGVSDKTVLCWQSKLFILSSCMTLLARMDANKMFASSCLFLSEIDFYWDVIKV